MIERHVFLEDYYDVLDGGGRLWRRTLGVQESRRQQHAGQAHWEQRSYASFAKRHRVLDPLWFG